MATPLFHADRTVTDTYYVIFTTQFGRQLLSGESLEPHLKGRLVHVHAEPVLEERTFYLHRKPIGVLLPMVTVRDVDAPHTLRTVIYDEHYVTKGENYQLINQLQAEAQRRSNAYNPLTRT